MTTTVISAVAILQNGTRGKHEQLYTPSLLFQMSGCQEAKERSGGMVEWNTGTKFDLKIPSK